MEFGLWLRAEIKRRGLTMSELARRIGVGHGTVSRWISGTRHPDTESARRIAQVLGVPPVVVLDMLGKRETPSGEIEQLAQRLARLQAERAGLHDEERQRGDRVEELNREIRELEIAHERLNPPEVPLSDLDFPAYVDSTPPVLRNFWPGFEEWMSRAESVGPEHRQRLSARAQPAARLSATKADRELRELLDVLTEHLNVGRDTNTFLHRVANEWSLAEQEAFAIGMQLGLVAGHATRFPVADDVPKQSTHDTGSTEFETENEETGNFEDEDGTTRTS